MASPSSLRPRNYNHHVFVSFHGPDVRKTLLSHIREQFNRNGITMFDDQKIERSATIGPSLIEAIKESRISIVILSKKYASSSWCLDELVEILESKKAMGQIVMTIFYGVDPSDVRKQIGEFGVAFDETCAHKTDEEIQKWSKALREVGNIAGEDFLRWDDEENCKRCLIKKIAKDVSDKLNATPSREFDGMVGLEAHLREMESLLDLDYDGVKMVGITGPAGIGKTTIARALQSRLSNRFQLTCFVDNLREMYPIGLDEFRLQEQFLSKVLNQDDIRICHSGVIEERLCKLRGLIILDDVNNIQQLMALANDTSWFGPGSRIVVTTENKELLQQHGIDNIYYVGFPSREEAVKILCKYAFEQTSPHHGFKLLAERITKLCGKLPLGLRVVGLSLHGKKAEEWVQVMRRLETIVDHRDIDQILRVVRKSKSRCFTVMAFLVVINLLSEIAAVVADQLYSIHKPYFARISLGMSSLSVVFSILDLSYKIRDHKARFRCKWPIPWFYYPSRGYNRIFGSFTDTVLLFCVVGGLIVSTINYIFIERRRDGPIKVSIWPLFFAIGMVGSKFMEKPTILKYNSLSQKLY